LANSGCVVYDVTTDQGRIQRGPWPLPQSSIEWIFLTEKPALLGLFSPPEVFCGPQIFQKYVGGRGSAPDPTGELTMLPQTP